YDPEKEREKRRERREYFREYKKIYYSRKENRDRKNACNRKYKYQKRYGELWESAMLVNDIKKEIQDGANGEITEGGVVENPEGTKGESGGPLCSGGDCRAGKGNSKDN
nr:hypothetical protein [Candidatus Saccharibacteria bacterium]